MAKGRKKSSRRRTSSAKATAAAKSTQDTTEDTAADTAEDTTPGAAQDAGKDPVGKTPKGTGKDPVKRAAPGGDVAEKAKDSTRSESVRKAAAAESRRTTGRRVAAPTQNPAWLAPTAVVLLIVGLAYLVTYYISAGQLPLPIGDWNLAAGFGVLMVGGGMLMFWK